MLSCSPASLLIDWHLIDPVSTTPTPPPPCLPFVFFFGLLADDGARSDIWSLGVVLFAMVAGFLPFEHENTAKLYDKILHARYSSPSHLSPMCRDLIARMLTVDPRRRIDEAGIRAHPWYRAVDVPPQPALHRPRALHDLDPRAVDEVLALGIGEQELAAGVAAGAHNHATAAYALVRRQLAGSSGDASGAGGRLSALEGGTRGRGRGRPSTADPTGAGWAPRGRDGVAAGQERAHAASETAARRGGDREHEGEGDVAGGAVAGGHEDPGATGYSSVSRATARSTMGTGAGGTRPRTVGAGATRGRAGTGTDIFGRRIGGGVGVPGVRGGDQT